MGLDSYFKIKKYETPDWSDLDLHLCGGMFSNQGGDGSFRGKVYADIIKEITGVGLYQPEIDHETIKEMAQKLSETEYNSTWKTEGWGTSEKEYNDLVTLFKRAAKTEDTVLLGWW